MALDEWLAVDGVPTSDAPEQYREAEGLEFRQEGLVVVERKSLTVVPWRSILSVIHVEDRVYALCPRRPPAPPWVELEADDAAEVGETLESLKGNIERRSQRVGYRDAGPTRGLLTPEELYQRLLANDPVPGTVEVPVGFGPYHRRSLGNKIGRAVSGAGMGAVGGLWGGSILATLIVTHPTLALVGSTAAATVVGAVGMLKLAGDRKGKGRVLALAPDGAVVGLPEGVGVYGWGQLGAFCEEERALPDAPHRSAPHLVVTDRDGGTIGAIDETWFDRPLSVIVPVAEAYRSRFTVK